MEVKSEKLDELRSLVDSFTTIDRAIEETKADLNRQIEEVYRLEALTTYSRYNLKGVEEELVALLLAERTGDAIKKCRKAAGSKIDQRLGHNVCLMLAKEQRLHWAFKINYLKEKQS